MREITLTPDCRIFVGDPGEPADFRQRGHVVELRPIEVYVLPDGSRDDRPSLVFLCMHPGIPSKFAVQISYEMLTPAILAALEASRSDAQ